MPSATEELLERMARIERQLANVLRRTRIAALDEDNARVRVVLAEEGDDGEPVLSAWLPWFTHRAGPDIDWHAPEVGEQVMLLSPGGQTELGCVLHSLYQDKFPAPEKRASARLFRFADGSEIHYDREAHVLHCTWVGDVVQDIGGNVTQTVVGNAEQEVGGNAVTTVAGSSLLTCPDNTIDGPLKVTQNIACLGGMTAVDGISSKGEISSEADVKAASISLRLHLTSGVRAGSDNSGRPV